MGARRAERSTALHAMARIPRRQSHLLLTPCESIFSRALRKAAPPPREHLGRSCRASGLRGAQGQGDGRAPLQGLAGQA